MRHVDEDRGSSRTEDTGPFCLILHSTPSYSVVVVVHFSLSWRVSSPWTTSDEQRRNSSWLSAERRLLPGEKLLCHRGYTRETRRFVVSSSTAESANGFVMVSRFAGISLYFHCSKKSMFHNCDAYYSSRSPCSMKKKINKNCEGTDLRQICPSAAVRYESTVRNSWILDFFLWYYTVHLCIGKKVGNMARYKHGRSAFQRGWAILPTFVSQVANFVPVIPRG